MIVENAPVFNAAGSGLAAFFNVNFNDDLEHEIPCEGTWQGDRKVCLSAYIDNYNNNFAVNVSSRNGTIRCPAYSQGYISIDTDDRLNLKAENTGIVQITLFTERKPATGFAARGNPPASVTDQYSTKLIGLYHMNGNNNASFIIDNAQGFGTLSLATGYKITTLVSKLGGSSLEMDTNYSNSDCPNTIAYQNNLTIEFFLYVDAIPQTFYYTIIDMGGSVALRLTATDGKLFGAGSSMTESVPLKKWVHVALVIVDGIYSLIFVDGIQKAISSGGGITLGNKLRIGSGTNGSSGKIYIDELRITNGVARYVANFTPPIVEFPNP